MRSKPRALPLWLLAGVLLAGAGCEEKVKPTITAGLSGEPPAQESWNARIVFTDSGKIAGILKAGHISVYADKRFTVLDSSITVDFYNEHEQHTSVLTARRGRVDDATHDFEAHEQVVVISDSGTVLKTEELYWANATRKIHTPAYVEITSPKEQLRGQGLESDQDLVHYTILKVTGQAKTDE
jgi:LPS export ABC transporter protein LptC